MSWLFTLFIYTHAAFCIGPPCLQSRLCVKSNRTPPNTPPALLSSDWLPRQNKQQPANLEFCPPAPTHLPWNKPLLRARQQPFFCCLLDLFIYVVGRLLGFFGVFLKLQKHPDHTTCTTVESVQQVEETPDTSPSKQIGLGFPQKMTRGHRHSQWGVSAVNRPES